MLYPPPTYTAVPSKYAKFLVNVLFLNIKNGAGTSLEVELLANFLWSIRIAPPCKPMLLSKELFSKIMYFESVSEI